jgi:hypothetical protein
MAQTVVVTAGTTAATSSSITIAAGAVYTFCLYASSGGLQADMGAVIAYDSPGGDVSIGALSGSCPAQQVQGPAQVLIIKGASSAACGVLQEA